MGPAAYRVAGIAAAIRDQGHSVEDWGDLALGSVAGAAAYAARVGRPLYLIWQDAHSDFHTP